MTKVHIIVLADRNLKLREIADTLQISEGSVFIILHRSSGMRKFFFKVGTAFAHTRSKTKTRREFRALFAAVQAR